MDFFPVTKFMNHPQYPNLKCKLSVLKLLPMMLKFSADLVLQILFGPPEVAII